MKALPYLLALMLLAVACDQPQGTQTDSEAALAQNEQALQPSQQPALPASTDQQPNTVAEPAGAKLLDQVANTRSLSTFAALIGSTQVADNLAGTGPYTLLAPTEAAFKALPDSVRQQLNDPASDEGLQEMLNNHIIAGKLTTADLQDGAILKTAAGHQLKVSKRDGKVRIGNALILEPDGMSSNGVLHTLDRVLVPVGEN